MAASDRQLLIEVIASDEGSEPVVRENTAAIAQMDETARQTSQGLQQVSKSQQNLRLSGSRANLVLMDTGRIIQDMPFGLRGVANNIDPFIQSLQRARAETGSWRQVLTGLMGSLTGPAGIAIAVSSVTSILVSFGPQIAEFFNIFEEGGKKVDKASDELDSFIGRRTQALIDEALQLDVFQDKGPFDTTQLEAQMRLISETLSTLPPVLSDEEKKELERLQDPEASAATGFATSADLSRSQLQRRDELLLKQARANQYAEERNQLETKLDELMRDHLVLTNAANTEQGKRIQQLHREQIIQEGINKAKEARQSVGNERPVDEILNANIDAAFPGLSDSISGSDFMGARGIDGMTSALQSYGFTLQEINAMTVEHAQSLRLQEEASRNLSTTLRNSLNESLILLGESIGNMAVGETNFNAILAQYGQLMGSFMEQYGRDLVRLGTASLALRPENLFTNPFAAIAAGVALIASAQAVKSRATSNLNRITGRGGARGNTIIGYRGLEIEGESPVGRVQGSGSRTIRIEDGFGNMVAKGQEEIDRGGGSNYMRGGE